MSKVMELVYPQHMNCLKNVDRCYRDVYLVKVEQTTELEYLIDHQQNLRNATSVTWS